MEPIISETYTDPRAKTTADSKHADMLYLSQTEPRGDDVIMSFSLYTENTEYGPYTREAVYHASSETSSWKRKLSLPSPFKKGHNERKRPADMMATTPSPQVSPPRTFNSASYFYRPSMVRRNAYTGKPTEPSGQPEPDDTLMDSNDDFVLPEPAIAISPPELFFAEAGPAGLGPAQGIIDVSAPKEERPRKRGRLASAMLLESCKSFVLSCLKSKVFQKEWPCDPWLEYISKWKLIETSPTGFC